jgi:hypothetical protein
VTLSPAEDRWTEVNDTWNGITTRRFIRRPRGNRVRVVTSTRVESQSSRQAEFLRQRTVAFEVRGFGPNETLSSVVFDGLTVTPEQ